MPPRQKTPAPIDRPLSRAYLREFSGWSTAYPPGTSEPTSLRIMENVQINRDGSVRVRPGLRYMSVSAVTGQAITEDVVGTHEAFFLNDGTKAYLFAVREIDDTVGFRVLVPTLSGSVVQLLDDVGIDFELPAVPTSLNFTSATTYVKYLQIDNKIFALSNAGEPMRLFYVGANKSAKSLASIEKPEWSVADKLSVVHPEAAWITSGVPTSVRTNLVTNPNFETGVAGWGGSSTTTIARSDTVGAQDGSYGMRIESAPTRTNLAPYALPYPVASITGWGNDNLVTLVPSDGGSPPANYMGLYFKPNPSGQWWGTQGYAYTTGYTPGVVAGSTYFVAFDIGSIGSNLNPLVRTRFYASNGAQVGGDDLQSVAHTTGRVSTGVPITAPAGAVYCQVSIGGVNYLSVGASMHVSNVVIGKWGESGTYFDGDSGTDYFWTGTANASASVYHPPVDVAVATTKMPVAAGEDYTGSLYIRAGSTVRDAQVKHLWYDASGTSTGTDLDTLAADTGAWVRRDLTAAAPAGTTQAVLWLTIEAVPRGEYHYVDAAQFEQASAVDTYFDGSTTSTSTSLHAWTGTAHGSTSTETALGSAAAAPSAETKTADTLIGTGTNAYNFGFFYTFANEVGESAASQVTVVKAQRGWSQWKWETANAAGEPSGTGTTDPLLSADQLVAIIPQAAYDQALDQGATSWKLYMLTWADQDPVPVSAIKVAERVLEPGMLYGSAAWLQATPQQIISSPETNVLPTETNRFNYSNPSHGGQGLVAADRMILVNDPTAQAVIRWSSNQQGSYTDFSANKGGGYKTLTSGNLYVPACVKLWQNPQSVDTLTILCMGVDGYSTGYYMAPAQVAQQSEATNVMGFEETSATPGTTSPFGCEVLNNALYHPLDEMLMKSTATNYNINHASMTDMIQDVWHKLLFKQRIVSSQHDNRLYYLVHNPGGETLQEGCWGNEVWVLDAAQKQGTWSRWLVQGQSLRKIEVGGKVVMSLNRPDGIYYFDPDYSSDDVIGAFIPGNLLTANQASMETDESDWAGNTVFGAYPSLPAVSSSAVEAQDGTQSVLLTWAGGGAGAAVTWSDHVLTIGETYTASIYVYVPTGSPDVRLDAVFTAQSAYTSVKDAWVRLSVTWVASSTAVFIGVNSDGTEAGGTLCYIDAAQIESGDTATTFTTDPPTNSVQAQSIPWRLESNTQGANRAHDAWAHLQQANIQLGFFQGELRYGIRGYDLHGKPVDISKIVRDSNAPGIEAYDLEDYLLIRRDMKEWFFYAESVSDDEDVVQPSAGQISLVQYRYTPSTVNTGYEFGSVETFEYGRSGNAVDQRTTDNGVPMPYTDTRRP